MEMTEKQQEYAFVLAMERAHTTLFAALAHDRIFDNPYSLKKILEDIINAVYHLHNLKPKRIHGDLKPLNIMRLGEMFRLIDFDVACSFGKCFGSKAPSTGYCPPEVMKLISNNDLGSYKAHASYDLWSLGVIAYRMASGQDLFQINQDDNIVADQVKDLEEWDEEKLEHKLKVINDDDLKTLLRKLLDKDPVARLKHFDGDIKVVLQQSYFDSSRDAVTGLLNQKTFQSAKKAWNVKAKSNLGAAAAVDLANFKVINDTYSHDTGDKALVRMAEQMKEECENFENAEVYRSGGDEFSILALCKDSDDEEWFKDKVKSLVEKICEISYEHGHVKSFTRVGAVCFIGAEYEDADKLEHEVKRKIMVKRGFKATSREPIYDTEKEER